MAQTVCPAADFLIGCWEVANKAPGTFVWRPTSAPCRRSALACLTEQNQPFGILLVGDSLDLKMLEALCTGAKGQLKADIGGPKHYDTFHVCELPNLYIMHVFVPGVSSCSLQAPPAAATLQSFCRGRSSHVPLLPVFTGLQLLLSEQCLTHCLVPAWVHTTLMSPQGFRLHEGAFCIKHHTTLPRVLKLPQVVLCTERVALSTVQIARMDVPLQAAPCCSDRNLACSPGTCCRSTWWPLAASPERLDNKSCMTC